LAAKTSGCLAGTAFKPGEGGSDGLRQRIAEDMRLFTAIIRERRLKFE